MSRETGKYLPPGTIQLLDVGNNQLSGSRRGSETAGVGVGPGGGGGSPGERLSTHPRLAGSTRCSAGVCESSICTTGLNGVVIKNRF